MSNRPFKDDVSTQPPVEVSAERYAQLLDIENRYRELVAVEITEENITDGE